MAECSHLLQPGPPQCLAFNSNAAEPAVVSMAAAIDMGISAADSSLLWAAVQRLFFRFGVLSISDCRYYMMDMYMLI